MCGIVGFSWTDKLLVKRLTASLRHRGPDQNGIFVDDIVSLGHTRLSIIDLSNLGHQPMLNEDGSIIIVFNGEIYNFQEMREKLKKYKFKSNTDTEVLLCAYEEYGFDCVKYFNGMFAFCIYDSKKQILFLARDRCGEKPLYYASGKNGLIFASELKTILSARLFPRKINQNALYNFLKFRYVPGPDTIVAGIKKLLPGHIAIYDLKTKKFSLSKYWNPLDEQSIKSDLKELIKNAVNLRLMSDVPLGVFLSGGIDSSSIVALMHESDQVENIKTFSVGFENWGFNETHHAKTVADYFNTDHKELLIKSDIANELPFILESGDEPLADPAMIPVFYLAKEAKKDVTVVLTGDGADEAFGGYDQARFLYYIMRLKKIPKPFRSIIPAITNLIPYQFMNKIYQFSKQTGPKMIERLKKAISVESISKTHEEIFCTFNDHEVSLMLQGMKIFHKDEHDVLDKIYFSNHHDLLAQIQAYDFHYYLPDSLLMKSDKMCMAHAIESRAPYLDPRIIGCGLHLPVGAKISLNSTKIIMKDTFRKVLPLNVIQRKKQPFQVPIHDWLKKDLAPLVEPKILSSSGFFKQAEIQKIIDKFDTSPLYYGRQLWDLMCFNIWYEQVFNK